MPSLDDLRRMTVEERLNELERRNHKQARQLEQLKIFLRLTLQHLKDSPAESSDSKFNRLWFQLIQDEIVH
jgi:hypothetical protein